MNQNDGSFKDYTWKGIDALLRGTAKAGEALRNASNRSIDRLDLWQLGKKLDSRYLKLGKKSAELMDAGTVDPAADPEVGALRAEIASIAAEIARRKESKDFAKKE